ncbi:hypothetical protein RHMOL_Rhmol04G0258500 [Rhododendron molle]|uniref:Uncharacterized protein n=1 Tax=Rhododendron molle TaxID=49168 RepID=A0ACC0P6Y0_RHOML|nr:hypothetical protein RHMOL_Rhmol04G0258500 [Rhododendron molle]
MQRLENLEEMDVVSSLPSEMCQSSANSSPKSYIPQVKNDLIPKINKEFVSLDAVYKFYNNYGKESGFGTREHSSKKNEDKVVVRKEMQILDLPHELILARWTKSAKIKTVVNDEDEDDDDDDVDDDCLAVKILNLTFSLYPFSLPTTQTPTRLHTKAAPRRHPPNDETSTLNLFYWASIHPNFKPTLPIYEEIIRKLGHVGSFDSMEQILDDMRVSNCWPTEGTFKIFIENYAKRDLYDEAIGVLDTMEQVFQVKPGRFSYNFLLNVLVDGKKFKLVESVCSMMLTRGVKPDVSTFNIVIKAPCKSHQTRFKEEMIAAQCPLSKVTVDVLIRGYCKEGRIEEALNFAEEMWVEGFRPDQFTFNCLVLGFWKSGHVKQALELFDLMLQEGFDPHILTYNTLIYGLCKSGQVDEAVEVLNKMISRDCSPDTVTYNTLISNLCKEKQMEQAIEIACIMTDKGILPDVRTFNSLIRGLCLTKNHDLAIDLFHGMKNYGCRPNDYTYNILINSLCSSGKIDRALVILKEMESSGCARDVVTYTPLIAGFCRNKKIEQAEEIFYQRNLQGVPRDKVAYNCLIDDLCMSKRMEKAAELMD